jgi:hypothetical protein
MNDRLLEIKKTDPTSGHDSHSDRDRLVGRQEQKQSAGNQNDGKFMKSFFEDVELVKQNIIKIISATEQIGEMNQEVRLPSSLHHILLYLPSPPSPSPSLSLSLCSSPSPYPLPVSRFQ